MSGDTPLPIVILEQQWIIRVDPRAPFTLRRIVFRLTIRFGQLSLPIVQFSAVQHNALEGGGHHPLSRPARRSENEQVAGRFDQRRRRQPAGNEMWFPCPASM